MRRTLLGQRIRAITAVVISVAVVGALAPAEAAPRTHSAPIASHAAPSGPVRAGADAAVKLSFALSTRVTTARPAEPGDHFKVAVGGTTYFAPSAGSWSCPTGVWVLQLDRGSLAEEGSTDHPLCTKGDAEALAAALTKIGSQKITIVNSLNHSPGAESLTLPGLGDALAKIGVPAKEFAAIDLSRTAFSVFGIPGLIAGQAYSATESLTAEASEPDGSATEASVNGTLALDNNTKFTLNPQDYVLYDIAANGAITLGGHTYPVPAEPAGFAGGFHVLVVDRRTLELVSDKLYSTNNNPSEQYRMGSDFAQLVDADNQSVMVFLATVGNPVGGAQLRPGPMDLPKPCAATAAFTVTCTYTPTAPGDGGSEQQFNVPAKVGAYPVTNLHVTAQGGYGGFSLSGGVGGLPDRVTADLPVGPGAAIDPPQTLYVEVAGEGTSGGEGNGGLGGWNGGGDGGASSRVHQWGWPGGGGGGASDIRTSSRANGNDEVSLRSRIIVAAGGGGAGGDSHDAGRGGDGGAANSNGLDGLHGSSSSLAGSGGSRGTASAGGAGGSGGKPGSPGVLGVGGTGVSTDDFSGASGGGAGGFYGGGSGGVGGSLKGGGGGGGGGGSDLVPKGGTIAPVTKQVPASVSISYRVPFGTLAQALRPFGATPSLITGLGNAPRYALVGTLASPDMIADGLSPDSPEASPQMAPGATGELQGVLQQGHQEMWYESITSNAPVVRTINGQTEPATVTNYGLYHVISDVHADWPLPVSTPISLHNAQQSALKYLSNKTCGCDNIRGEYNADQNTIVTWKSIASALTYTPNPDFSQIDFIDVQGEIVAELTDVFVVDGLKNGMGTLLGDQQQMLQPALTSAYKEVRNAITVPDNTKLAVSIATFILELFTIAAEATQLHGIAAALGVVNAILKFSTELATDKDGNDEDALGTTADQLGEETANNFADALNSLSQTFSYIYEDYGKLAAVADGLLNNNPAWDVSATNAGQYVTAARNAIKLSYYRALVPIVYKRFETQAAPTDQLSKWCLFTKYGDHSCTDYADEYWAYPSSAYSFPVQALAYNFKPAHDNFLVIATDTTHTALTPELMTNMTDSGLYPPYLFLRWPMDGFRCPIDIGLQFNPFTPFFCTDDAPQLSQPPIMITTRSLPAATQGKQYHAALKATGSATNEYHWTVQSGSHLPAGLALSTKGVLSGVPTTHGKFPVRVTVNGSASATLTLMIHPPKHTLANSGVPTLPLLILAGVLIVVGVLLTARRRNTARRSSSS